ncbi:MAG: XTP/dITP diphosphatase [Promethearchaeota archaeon]
MLEKITFVTGNKHKFSEVAAVFSEKFPEIEVLQSTVEPIEIQADTLEEVAKTKATSIQQSVKPPYFIEDAGFFVDDEYHGFPGPYSHYVMDTLGCAGILKLLGDATHRKAHFESVIAFVDSQGHLHNFKGINAGHVAYEARGTSGFGFDPIFISDDTPDRTFAEIGFEEKNAISHRRRALELLIKYLQI